MNSKNDESQKLKFPKGVRMSRRLRIVVIGIVIGVVVLFLIFLKHYAPKSNIAYPDQTSASANAQSASTMIKRIQREKPEPILIKEKAIQSSHDSLNVIRERMDSPNKSQAGLTAKTFAQGGESDISVYHRAWPEAATYGSQHASFQNQSFLQNDHTAQSDYIPSKIHKPLSKYEIKAGTIIPATLETGINSDLPGEILAKVRRDVFDTKTGNYLLIPQGTTLIGHYNSQIAYGQSHVLVVWNRMIFPNGNSFELHGQLGVDLTGKAGLKDQVNNHYFRAFCSALILSIFGAAGQLSQPRNNSQQYTTQQILYGVVGQQLNQTAAQMIEENLNIQPTITVRFGADFNILLMSDISLAGKK